MVGHAVSAFRSPALCPCSVPLPEGASAPSRPTVGGAALPPVCGSSTWERPLSCGREFGGAPSPSSQSVPLGWRPSVRRQWERRGGVGMAASAVAGGALETAVEGNGAAWSAAEGRVARVQRETKETSVDVALNLDGSGRADNQSGIHFLDHMLDQIASHGLFDVRVRAKGDTWIDDHHTNEDLALAFGKALADALGDRKGIHRFGNFCAPLDEALVQVVLDLSGRPHLSFDLALPTERIGNYETQLVEHFFQSLVNTSGMTLHIRQLAGKNSHHIVEATFKAFARALRQATEHDPRRAGTVPSSKGVLTQQ
ncbi:imidazoleglycerol-phosphate dehydratase [Klebsormidium nitens]|uniref:Imidazoleglycerol-phosphate dehydratase n=1 Tax=Klebsormidium nitens TaxID=105231 RepID=A0A0U9HHN9_KLENI|nr:imidazoleglycerol-phosphate dehydratase [Klebsormidium nitens]|eukprot:GAQ77638.1 imidazoleglycerol-phosphate dehydratase [Klebsormidium nitens]